MSDSKAITNDDLLNATNPEALAALMAKAGEQSQESGQGQQGEAGDASATNDPAAADAAGLAGGAQGAPAGAAPGASEEIHSGVATKSGKGVLPYRVLQEAREDARTAKAAVQTLADQLAETQRRLEEAQASLGAQQRAAGVAETSNPEDLTDDEIAAVEADFPAVAKAMRVARAAAQRVAVAGGTTVDPQEEADERTAAIESALAGKTLLLRAREQGGVLWARACEIDAQLRADPNFASIDPGQRFAKVQSQLASELGVAIPAPSPATPNAPAPAPRIDPIRLNTTSDLIPGASPGNDEAFGSAASGMAMARRFSDMTPQQIDAAIRRSV